jgi:hypothetical protein
MASPRDNAALHFYRRLVIAMDEIALSLKHSLRNLQRAGFQEVYEKEVYEWNA